MNRAMRTNDALDLLERIDREKQEFLKGNGWTHTMWRWYWVWRKQAHDITFSCLSLDEAVQAETTLQASASCYQPQTKESAS